MRGLFGGRAPERHPLSRDEVRDRLRLVAAELRQDAPHAAAIVATLSLALADPDDMHSLCTWVECWVDCYGAPRARQRAEREREGARHA